MLVGCRRNETLAIDLELQLEKVVSPVKLQLTIYIRRQKGLPNFFGEKFNSICTADIIGTFQRLYETINDRKHRNIILIPLSGSWRPRPPFQ